MEYISIFISLLSLILLISFFFYIKNSINNQSIKNIHDDLTENFYTSLERLSNISNSLDNIKEKTDSMSIPIMGLNRYLGGNASTGRLGEWNLESIVKDIIPMNKYKFQFNINPETQKQVDCAVETSDKKFIPIDAKFYPAQYDLFQEATKKDQRDKALKELEKSINSDASDIADKYIVEGVTTNIAVLYVPSEGLMSMVNLIENLRDRLLREKNILIMGPNSLAGFLDSVRMGHKAVELNENASLVSKVVGKVKDEFNLLDMNTNDLKKAVETLGNKIENYQTRINVMRKTLNSADSKLNEDK